MSEKKPSIRSDPEALRAYRNPDNCLDTKQGVIVEHPPGAFRDADWVVEVENDGQLFGIAGQDIVSVTMEEAKDDARER